jgi:hypothetical protein
MVLYLVQPWVRDVTGKEWDMLYLVQPWVRDVTGKEWDRINPKLSLSTYNNGLMGAAGV